MTKSEAVGDRQACTQLVFVALVIDQRAVLRVELALVRNLQVRAAELQAAVAEVDADAAFSVFLPHVEASFGYRTQSEIPAISYQGQALQMTEEGL